MWLQTPSDPWILSLAPLLGTQYSIQWIAVSIHLCICQAMAEPLRRQLYQAPVSKLVLASAIVSGFGGCILDGSPGEAVSRCSFFQSLLHTVSVTPSMGILFPLLRGILSFWANIHLSVSAYHVCSFVIGLVHSRRYPPDTSICLRIL